MYSYSPRKRRRALKGHVLADERTERRRRRLRWRRLLIVLGLAAAATALVYLYFSPLLRVQEVEVVGTNNVSAQQVAELADLKGERMLTAPLREAEARIAQLPLVKAAKAELKWPNKVRIQVVERAPWGYWDLAGNTYVIDAEGVILPDVQPGEGAPVIYDVGAPADLSPGDLVDTDAVRLAQELLKSVPDQLALNITKFEYTPEEGLSLLTDAGYRVVVGDSQNVDFKLAVWKAVEEDFGREEMAGQVLDLRFRDRPSLYSERKEATRR